MAATKVVLAGASGNLGPAVLKELLDAGLEVTIFTRQNSNKTFDSRAKVAAVNYDSVDALKAALSGQEVVVDTLAPLDLGLHLRLIDASVAAGVTRFIPSEFGADTTNALAAKLPVYGNKVAVQEHLKRVSAESDLSYTLVLTGAFLEFGLQTGFLVNLAGPAELYDGGEGQVSISSLPGIGQAVVGVVRNLDKTRNETVYVSQVNASQKELLGWSGKRVETKVVRTEDLERLSYEEIKKPQPDLMVFAVGLLRRAIFGEGYGGLFDSEKLSNELLGVRSFTEEEVREIVRKFS
ncbi:putative isoflavone reductase [Aspergillus avenaceus]|uniref:Putative isoflavone reductase n=1 Tax=Aspergillus avenaceus TaxID=36643 RepID=A0A5N6TL48_ASPAV|nr:putative isoflavone reductase [Aspergillus avenaceus]